MSENYYGSDPIRDEEEYGDYLQMTEESLDELVQQVREEDLDRDVVEPKESYKDTISSLLDRIDTTPEYQSFVNFIIRELEEMDVEDDEIRDIVNRFRTTTYSSN